MTSAISLVTTALPERIPFLRRLAQQAPWVRNYEWIICGPARSPDRPLLRFAREVDAIYIESDEIMGTCRNLCAEAATGEIIVQIDDDDWQHPARIAKQVEALKGVAFSPHREVVGSSWLYCLHAPTATASRISYWDSMHCLPGATLAYWRSAWQRHPFQEVRSEDGPFTTFFGEEGTCFDMHDPKLIVYMRHGAHLPEQRDWWRETREIEASPARKLSAYEQMQQRILHPNRPLALQKIDTSPELVLAHEREAATVYVRWLMGEKDFSEFVGEVVHDEPDHFDAARE